LFGFGAPVVFAVAAALLQARGVAAAAGREGAVLSLSGVSGRGS
jgi:hypothetical protein